jgi:hypothetical protein
MKNFFSLLILLSCSVIGAAQSLQVGVPVNLVLSTDYFIDYPMVNCHKYEFAFGPGMSPYATGVNLYWKVDSIKGGIDSILINRSPDYVNAVVHVGDTIPVLPTLQDQIKVNSFALDTVYTSIVAIGTPAASGQPYFCSIHEAVGILIDGCTQTITFNYMNYTADTCYVLPPAGMNEYVKNNAIRFYPNPTHANSEITFYYTVSTSDRELLIHDITGKEIRRYGLPANSSTKQIQLPQMHAGLYVARLSGKGVDRMVKFVVE